MISRLQWWAYMLMVICIFLLCLLLNLVVKKINEIRLQDKFLRLQDKASRNGCTQVQEESIPIELTSIENDEQAPKLAPNGASLVYKEDNINNAHGKSNANPPKESNSKSQSKIDAANSKLNFLGAIYTDLLPSKEIREKPNPMQICDNDNGSIFKEVTLRKASIYENTPTN